MKKQFLAVLLTLAMLLSILPASALATEGGEDGEAPVVCTQNADCAAEIHNESCPKYVAPDPEADPADVPEENPTGVPDEPDEAPAEGEGDSTVTGPEQEELVEEPTAEEKLAKLIAALPDPAKIDPLDEEQMEAVYNQISAIYAFAEENGLGDRDNGLLDKAADATVNAVIAAMNPVQTLAEPVPLTEIGGTLSDGTYTVDSTLTLTEQVTISGNVTISGSGTIKRGEGLTTYMIVVPKGSSLTLNGVTIDGGAKWSTDESAEGYDSTLGRSTTNTGVSANAAMIYNLGELKVAGNTVLQNNSNESKRANDSGEPIFATTIRDDNGYGAKIMSYPGVNEETRYGGAVLNGGTMTISGGTIKDNQAFRGAGVCSYGILKMTDGTITTNHTVAVVKKYADGAGIYLSGGKNNGTVDNPLDWTAESTKESYCEISGGSITKNVSDGNAGGVIADGHSKLYLSGNVSITENICGREYTNAAGGGVSLYSAYGEISGGTISENTSEQSNAGGISVGAASTLKMTGGTVSKNKTAKDGGGISITSGSTAELSSGVKITENSAANGGGVNVTNGDAKLTINGAEISKNTAATKDTVAPKGAGVYVNTAASVVMSSGSIAENSIESTGENAASIFGGGVYVNGSDASFELKGGTIGGNSLTLDNGSTTNRYAQGAGVYVNNGSFTLSGGKVGGEDNGNTIEATKSAGANANAYGAGVFVNTNGTFTMTGGEISYNSAEAADGESSSSGNVTIYGGGLYATKANLTLTGGAISQNTAEAKTGTAGNAAVYGGGAYLQNQTGDVTIGVEITDNDAKAESSVGKATATGGGLYVTGTAAGSITLSGKVNNNTAEAASSSNQANSATAQGGGVYTETCSFVLTGTVDENKLIANNSADATKVSIYGGGIYSASGGLTIADGASISGNVLASSGNGGGGGLRIGSSTTAAMNGGKISKNIAKTTSTSIRGQVGGGGVDVAGTFIINGGEISGNVADGYDNGGGAVRVNGASAVVTLNDGLVSGNISVNSLGSAGQSKGSGAFHMTGGGRLNICGGTITGNAAYRGGAISFIDGGWARGTVNITGGTITGNYCTSGDGGAIYMPSAAKSGDTPYDQTVNISGNPVITGNYKGATISKSNNGTYSIDTNGATTENNVYLAKNTSMSSDSDYAVSQTLVLNGALTPGATIGVTTQTAPTTGNSVQITTAEKDADTAYYKDAAQYFVADAKPTSGGTYLAEVDSEKQYVKLCYTNETYYKVTLELENITCVGGTVTQVKENSTYSGAIQASTGYSLPASIESPESGVTYAKNGNFASISMTVTQDTTIKVVGVANTYTVAFDANGGSGNKMSSQSMTYDVAQELTANTYSKANYNFAGWATSADGTCEHPDRESVKNLATDNGVTVILYAVWTAKEVINKFDDTNAAQSHTYDGSQKTYKLTSDIEGFKITYKQGETEFENPTDVGTYDVVISRNEDDIYAAFTQTIANGLVITAADYPVSITADKTSMTGSDTVKLTVSATIDGVTVTNVTCSDSSITVTKNDDGTYSATLPNTTKTYTFTAEVDGVSANYGSGPATCTVSVTRYISGGGGGSSSGGSTTYTVTVDSTKNGTVTVSPKNASKGATVTITVKPNSGYEVDDLTVTDKNGDTVRVKDQGNGKYTFTMPASKVTVEASFTKIVEQPSVTFADVPTSAYYYDAVAWAVENGITSGTTATTFSPNAACTRAQTVTFLWRAAGSPAPKSSANPFTDVQPGAYYYDAVLWAVEQGITTGTTATTFSPNATVTRGQTVTFLHRAAGTAVAGSNPFTDVADSAYYAGAVKWAVAEGITSGTSATTFSPNQVCTRAQIVTFLYRAYA